MKQPLSLKLFFFFAVWGTFKAFESLVRTIPGSQDMYANYSLEWLYYVVTVFTGVAGLALIYGLWKAKPWPHLLGTVWLVVGIAHTIFTGAVSYLNKPLMLQILTESLEKRGRDIASAEAYINSPVTEITVLATSSVLIVVMLFFIWKLWQHRVKSEVRNENIA